MGMVAFLGTTAEKCDNQTPLVTIKYEQIGGCQGAGHTFAGTDAAFVVFRIISIDNTGTNARDFDFNPDYLYVNTDPHASVSSDHAKSLAIPYATFGQKVAAGTRADRPGDVLAVVANPTITITDKAAQRGQIERFSLFHDTAAAGTQGVLVTAQGNQATFPYEGDCQRLSY